MQKTNLTIVPSEWNEQYGRVIQEASVCGSVVIGSNIGAIPEILIKKNLYLNQIMSMKLRAKLRIFIIISITIEKNLMKLKNLFY